MAKMDEMLAKVEAVAAGKTGAHAAPVTGHLAPEDLAKMKRQDLEQLAKDMGLDAHACKNKQEIVDLIAAEQVQVDTTAEDTTDGQGIDAADVITVLPDDQSQEDDRTSDSGPAQSPAREEETRGVVLVTYNGAVNLRTMDGVVDGLAHSGQTFTTDGTVERDGQTWYRVTDQAGKAHTIRADLCRFMAQ